MVYKAGELVYALAGHDAGRPYLILEDQGDRVKLADGRIRTVSKPKLKKKKHVQLKAVSLPEICDKIADGSVTDADLVYAIRKLKGECNV
jgi:ribosomal protein L14E/L6E/L27E